MVLVKRTMNTRICFHSTSTLEDGPPNNRLWQGARAGRAAASGVCNAMPQVNWGTRRMVSHLQSAFATKHNLLSEVTLGVMALGTKFWPTSRSLSSNSNIRIILAVACLLSCWYFLVLCMSGNFGLCPGELKYCVGLNVMQWVRIHLPGQGDVGLIPGPEDFTCHRASSPRAITTEPAGGSGTHRPQGLEA